MLHQFFHRDASRRLVVRLGISGMLLVAFATAEAQQVDAVEPAGQRPEVSAGAPLVDPITDVDRRALRDRIRPHTVVVRRVGALPRGMWAPGGGQVEAHGWWADGARVVTASVVVEGWPVSPKDSIEVELADGRRFSAGVGVSDAALGLAVLDVPGLPAPPSAIAAGVGDAGVSPGRPLYSADASGLLHRLVIGGRAGGQLAYYWRLVGSVAPGTPLFDATGRIVTLAGRLSVDPTVGLALPAKALRALVERSDWRR